jgi:predicted amidohydrolase
MTLFVKCHQTTFSSKKSENLQKILHLIDISDAELDVFPEYAMGVPSNGLSQKFIQKNAEALDGNFISKILEKTQQKGSSTVFSTFLREKNLVFNTAILAEAGRIRLVYKKIHLFDAFGYQESTLFTPGMKLAISEFKEFRIGLAVCFDLRFPELFRMMAYRGVNLFIVPSAWYVGKHKLEQWRILVRARAHENTSYLVAANQTRPFFIGHSLVASPLGYTIHEIEEDQTSFKIELDITEIEETKKAIPVIDLSKPYLYKTFNNQS